MHHARPAVAAVLLHLGGAQRHLLPWLIAAAAFYLVAFVVTAAVNVALNNRLNAAGPVAQIQDPSSVRASFELDWVRWNVIRTVAPAGSLLALGIALLRR